MATTARTGTEKGLDAVRKIARHRHALPARMRSPAATDTLHDEMWGSEKRITVMPIMVRICTLRSGQHDGEPTFMTAPDLRETLILALGPDEARIDFVCRQVEETGSCELGDEGSQSSYRFEKILHA